MKVTSVSYSSDKKLVRCDQQYSYRYDDGLKPRVKKEGLFRGNIIHDLLEAHRRNLDWEKKLKEIKKTKYDPLFDEEKEILGENFLPHIEDLFGHYVDHWEIENKRWKIIHIEKMFSINTRFGFPIRWKADLIVKEGKATVLVENKNKKKIPEPEERILAPQPHGYCFLFQKIGINIDTILWDYIRTEPVPRPQINKDGSLSKRKIQTDQRGYLLSLKEAGIKAESEEDIIGLQNHLDTLPETLSLLRVRNTPNLRVGELYIRDWIDRAIRARETKRPTRNWDRSCKWGCDYFNLCQIDMTGKGSRDIEIKKNFVRTGDIKNAGN